MAEVLEVKKLNILTEHSSHESGDTTSHGNVVLMRFLRLSLFLIFAGRAYQYLFFDAPFRAIFWDQQMMEPVVQFLFNISWEEYAADLRVTKFIQWMIKANGFLFMAAAVGSLVANSKNIKFWKYPLFFGALSLGFLAALQCKEKFYHVAQFFELSIQFGLPILAIILFQQKIKWRLFYKWINVLIALTFTAHGLYALGLYPVPGHFIDMTINAIHVQENTAVSILKVVGILDIVISMILILPNIFKLHFWALLYACIWGLATALARMAAGIDFELFQYTLHQTTYLTIFRLPHGLVPLMALILLIKNKNRI